MKHLITGGAGFIGSHLVDYLMENGEDVLVIDDLSAGDFRNIERWKDSDNFMFVKGDLLDPESINEALAGCEVVYHLAANPEVRWWLANPEDHFKQNIEGTYNLLEAVRQDGGIDTLVFTSTSTVYGEPNIIPTPETYAPSKPISHYGASKLAAEALICSYAAMYGFMCIIYRMANVVGPRSNHGVVYDFVEKLKNDSHELEVLGDGTQSKSYLYISDCVEGMVLGVKNSSELVSILNIGSEDRVDVLTIAEIVTEEMGLEGVKIRTTGGVDGGRGWKGDVKLMQLDMSRLRELGWHPRWRSSDAVRLTAKSLVNM
uniref:UDP-glucose 4-epimerase n=1 Tax=uncultured marine crenarchaeote E6-3G TaxID=907719 RepID=G9BAK2_9ARCH|nr:UDP-glucose 4-epimerase [uncultured marine crenarchaeote E6-3G]